MKRALVFVFVLFLVASLAPAATAGATVGFMPTALPVKGALDVAVGDLDGKNGPDIVASTSEGLEVLLNNGNGTFGAPHLYPTGCPSYQVELADLGGTNGDNTPDGHLDAAILCVFNSGDTQELGRLAGDGNGGFGTATIVPALNLGAFGRVGPQRFALAQMRGPGLPPVPIFTYGTPDFRSVLCSTYDWQTSNCLGAEYPQVGDPLIAGTVAEARIFGLGGEKGIVDFGAPQSTWLASTRELAPELPTSAEDFYSLTIGDLGGNGPDIISAAGTCGCGYKDSPAAGQIDVLYGDTATGVPDQVGTKFASAPGIDNIATGDFNVDGKEDLIGSSWSCNPATLACTGGVFVQEGDGKGGLGAPQMIPLSNNESFSRAPVRVADLDGNGGPDAVAIVGGQVQVLLNTQAKAAPLNPFAGIKKLPKSASVDKNGNLILGSATNPPTASVDLTVLLPFGKGGKKPRPLAALSAKQSGKKRGKVIGHAKIAIPAGHERALKVHLKGPALAQLKKGKALKTKLTIVAVATDGTSSTKTQPLTIKPPKKGKKHHR